MNENNSVLIVLLSLKRISYFIEDSDIEASTIFQL